MIKKLGIVFSLVLVLCFSSLAFAQNTNSGSMSSSNMSTTSGKRHRRARRHHRRVRRRRHRGSKKGGNMNKAGNSNM